MTDKSRKFVAAYAFLLPALAGLVVFRILPVISAFVGSLFEIDYGHGGASRFAGIGNFISLFTDFVFWDSVKVTLVFNVIINPLQIAFALFMALLVQHNTRLNRSFRSFYMLPLGVSITVASAIWAILFHPNDGLVNGLLQLVHLHSQPFLTSSVQAFWCIILVASWYGISYWLIFLLAGLQEISRDLYEAAVIDGSNAWSTFWRITLPSIRWAVIYGIVLTTARCLGEYGAVAVVSGSIQGKTETATLRVQEEVENLNNAGAYGIALTLALISVLVLILMTTLRPKEGAA